jgi:hypothetical protein
VRLECSTATAWLLRLSNAGDAVGAVLGAAENQHGIVIHAFEQLDEQIGFLHGGDGIDDVLDRFGGRAARADLDRSGLCIAHSMSVSISAASWRKKASGARAGSGR